MNSGCSGDNGVGNGVGSDLGHESTENPIKPTNAAGK